MAQATDQERQITGQEAPARRELEIEGMTCASCVRRVERALGKVPGVAGVTVNLATGKAEVVADSPAGLDPQALVDAVRAAGYDATVAGGATGSAADPAAERGARRRAELRRRLVQLAAGAVLSAGVLVAAYGFGGAPWSRWVQAALAAPVYAWVGWLFHRGALQAARHGSADMDTLVSLGASVAFWYSLAAPSRPWHGGDGNAGRPADGGPRGGPRRAEAGPAARAARPHPAGLARGAGAPPHAAGRRRAACSGQHRRPGRGERVVLGRAVAAGRRRGAGDGGRGSAAAGRGVSGQPGPVSRRGWLGRRGHGRPQAARRLAARQAGALAGGSGTPAGRAGGPVPGAGMADPGMGTLAARHPGLAAVPVVSLLGLAGTPPTAVFPGNLQVFTAAIDGGHGWLAGLAVANTAASLFCCL